MQKNYLDNIIEKTGTRTFFLIIFIYQLFFIFQGIDMADAGFYGSFYQQIFSSPETVQYGFMYWFSGIVGGLFLYIFPDAGMLGLRVLYVITTTATLIITYSLLKKYLKETHLKIGLLFVILFISNKPRELNYNTISYLLYITAAWCLFTGLTEKKLLRLFLSGLTIAFAAFTRLPNVLGMGLGIIILYYGFINGTPIKYRITQTLLFVFGFIFGTAIILLSMKLLGHLDIFINVIKLVFLMGKGDENAAQNTYGIMNLLNQAFAPHLSSLKNTMFIFAVLAMAMLNLNLIKIRFPYLKLLVKFLKYFVIAVFLFFIIKDKTDETVILRLVTGTLLIFSFFIFATSDNTKIKTLLLIGVFLMIVYPFGSSAGLFTVGVYTSWIIMPIVTDFIFNIRSVNNELRFVNTNLNYSFTISISESQFTRIKNYGLLVCIFLCLFFDYYYPYFDRHERTKMHYSVNHKWLKGIYTSEDRAQRINELLKESSKYVQKDDFVLAYDCIPMFNYLTSTKPYMRNPWPYLYEPGMFKRELELAFNSNKTLPVVIYQKIKSIGSGSDWPSAGSANDKEWEQTNKKRNDLINDFLAVNNYKEVWSNDVFRILTPPGK